MTYLATDYATLRTTAIEPWTVRRRSERTTAPTVAFLTLDDAKRHLRRTETIDDDEVIEALIVAAIDYVEADTQRAFITQAWRTWFDSVPCGGTLLLERGKAIAVSAVTAYDTADAATTVATSVYQVDTVSDPARVSLKSGQSWPSDLRAVNAISVTYTAGYGAAASAVPGPVKQAALLVLGAMYEHREQVIVAQFAGQFLALPFGYDQLIAPYRCQT